MSFLPTDPLEYFDAGVALKSPWIPEIPPPVPKWAQDALKPSSDPTTPQSEQRSTRMQDKIQLRRILPHDRGPQWYPLAAIVVPRGEIGFLYGIQTQINGISGEEWRIWYRNADPYSFLWEVPNMSPQAAPRWRLVLENRDPDQSRTPRRIQQIEPGPLQVHPDLATWNDGRFVPNGSNYRIKIMIPEGTTARLWVCMPIPQLQEASMPNFASGRLVGFTQSWSDNNDARFNARRAW